MHVDERTDPIIREYANLKKYYCRKCKFWKLNKCEKNRIVKECIKKRLKNV